MIDTVPLNLFVQTILDDPARSHKCRALDAAGEIESWCRLHYAIPEGTRLEIPTEWEHRVPLLLESELEVLLAEEPEQHFNPHEWLPNVVAKIESSEPLHGQALADEIHRELEKASWSGRVRGWWNR